MTAPRKYNPVGAALQLWRCDAKEILVFSGAGTGKTRAALEKVALAARKYPGCRVLLTRATRASMTESTLVTLERDVLVTGSGKPEPWVGSILRRVRQSYTLPNGSEIIVAGLDTPDRVLGTEYDYIIVDEATEVDIDAYEKVMGRLRNHKTRIQQAICICNPTTPLHWLYQRMQSGLMVSVVFTHKDNPLYYDSALGQLTAAGKEYIQGTLERYTGVRRLRFLEGKWAAAEGLIYDNFDRAVHVRGPVGATVSRLVGVDDGFTNPFAAVELHIDGDGRCHVADERYESGLLESAKLERIRSLTRSDPNCMVVADPAAAGLIGAMRNAGIPVIEANNDVLAGIGRMRDRLGVAGDGHPRLTFSPSCTHMLRELETYEWNDRTAKEQPVKEHDHLCDAARYAIMHIDRSNVTRIYTSSEPNLNGKGSADAAFSFQRAREADSNFGFDPDDDV